MYCVKCGKELQNEDMFCSGCGASTVQEKVSVETSKETETPEKGNTKLLLNITVIVCTLVICFLTPNNSIVGTWKHDTDGTLTIKSNGTYHINSTRGYQENGSYNTVGNQIIVYDEEYGTDTSTFLVNNGKLYLDDEVFDRASYDFSKSDWIILVSVLVVLFSFETLIKIPAIKEKIAVEKN